MSCPSNATHRHGDSLHRPSLSPDARPTHALDESPQDEDQEQARSDRHRDSNLQVGGIPRPDGIQRRARLAFARRTCPTKAAWGAVGKKGHKDNAAVEAVRVLTGNLA